MIIKITLMDTKCPSSMRTVCTLSWVPFVLLKPYFYIQWKLLVHLHGYHLSFFPVCIWLIVAKGNLLLNILISLSKLQNFIRYFINLAHRYQNNWRFTMTWEAGWRYGIISTVPYEQKNIYRQIILFQRI